MKQSDTESCQHRHADLQVALLCAGAGERAGADLSGVGAGDLRRQCRWRHRSAAGAKVGGCALPHSLPPQHATAWRAGQHDQGIGLAQGEYVKFLHDDDVLAPDCIAQLVEAIERNPGTAMASSRRQRIDGDGQPLPDILATCFPFADDVLIDGPELVSFLADHTINFIGEPSCVLARRADLLALGNGLMALNGKAIDWVGDLAIYVKLLRRGNLAFLASPLTQFRVSSAQFSQGGRDQVGVGDQGHDDLRQGIRQLGWRRETGDNRQVRVARSARTRRASSSRWIWSMR